METHNFDFLAEVIKHGKTSQEIDKIENKLASSSYLPYKSVLFGQKCILEASLELYTDALNDAKLSFSFDQSNYFIYLIQGILLLWNKKENEAVEIFKDITSKCPNLDVFMTATSLTINPDYRSYVFSISGDILKLKEALSFWQSSDLSTKEACTILQLNQLTRAIKYFTELLSTGQDSFLIRLGRGAAYFMSEEWDLALKDLTIARELRPNDYIVRKYIASTLTSQHRYTQAIEEMTFIIETNSTNYEAYLERALIHMLRGNYTQAISDFRCIPAKYYKDRLFLYVAECIYATGDVIGANDVVKKAVSEDDHRKAYCQFLIARDMGDIPSAAAYIQKAAKLRCSFFLYRVAADFFCETGHYDLSTQYYSHAMSIDQNDVETQVKYAVALFYSGQHKESMKILTKFNSSDPYLISLKPNNENLLGSLNNFNQRCSSILSDINGLIARMNQMLTYPKDPISLSSYAVTRTPHNSDSLTKMLHMADKLGNLCCPKAYEVIQGPRLKRILGLSVLSLASSLRKSLTKTKATKKASIKTLTWKDYFDEILAIFGFIDVTVPVCYSHMQGDANNRNIKAYYLIRGERRSQRYASVMEVAMHQLRECVSEYIGGQDKNYPELFHVLKLDLIYSIVQTDFTTTSHWKYPPIFSLLVPPLNIRQRGSTGFDLFVTPPWGTNYAWRYDQCMQTTWDQLLSESNASEVPNSLAGMILLIWTYQPFTEYSDYLGHVLLHAYMLAYHNVHVGMLEDKDVDLFMNFVIQPSYAGFVNLVYDKIKGSITPISEDTDDMLEFFKNGLSNEEIIQFSSMNLPLCSI